MDKKTKAFIEESKTRYQGACKSAIERFADYRGNEPDVKQGIIIKKTKNIKKIISNVQTFNRDTDYAAYCCLQLSDYQETEFLKFMKKNLDAQVTMLKNISKSDLGAYTLPHQYILMDYFNNIAVLTYYFYGVMLEKDKIQLIKNIIPAFWEIFEAEQQSAVDKEDGLRRYLTLTEAVFDLQDGGYRHVIQQAGKLKLDALKFEDIDKTCLKLCIFLAKFAIDPKDKKVQFGAEAMVTLAQYQYYLYRSKGFLNGSINLSRLMLLTYLYGDICGLSEDEIHKSVQPDQVMQNLERLRKQNDGTVYLPKSLGEKPRFNYIDYDDDGNEIGDQDEILDAFCGKAVAFVGSAGNAASVYFGSRSHGWDAERNGKIQNAGDINEILVKTKEFSADADAGSYCYLKSFNAWPEQRAFFQKVLNVQPALLASISKSDLQAYPLDGLKALLEYFYKYTLFTRYFSGAMPDRNQLLQFKSVFPVFWEKFEGEAYDDPAAREFDREYFGAIEMIFDFLAGEYESVDRRIGPVEVNFSEFESVNRTAMKLCSCLSDIRQNRNGETAPFGADSMLAIAQHQFYLYVVLQDAAVTKTVFPFIMLLTYLHGDVRGVSEEGMHKSLQAEHILDKLDDLQYKIGDNDSMLNIVKNILAGADKDGINTLKDIGVDL
ncbi:MAG: hypothetical protein FWB85_05230 [Chitinispirillia bacterium]|nr:hypothetical protein [Chitinispirillia bacterium]